MIKLYGYKKCGTCRKAESVLTRLEVDFAFIDITENPPTASALKSMALQSGRPITKMFNTSGVVYRENDVKSKLPTMTDQEMLALLASNGRLIKRPIVTDGTSTTVGFDDNIFKKTWA